MSVNWEWKHKKGEIIYKDNETKKTFKIGVYGGNCLGAFIYRYKNEKKEKMYNFIMFINDIKHAKKILKDDPNFFNNLFIAGHKVKCFKCCVTSQNKYDNKEMLELAELLTKYKYKVILY